MGESRIDLVPDTWPESCMCDSRRVGLCTRPFFSFPQTRCRADRESLCPHPSASHFTTFCDADHRDEPMRLFRIDRRFAASFSSCSRTRRVRVRIGVGSLVQGRRSWAVPRRREAGRRVRLVSRRSVLLRSWASGSTRLLRRFARHVVPTRTWLRQRQRWRRC
jgi:hypothetical protein